MKQYVSVRPARWRNRLSYDKVWQSRRRRGAGPPPLRRAVCQLRLLALTTLKLARTQTTQLLQVLFVDAINILCNERDTIPAVDCSLHCSRIKAAFVAQQLTRIFSLFALLYRGKAMKNYHKSQQNAFRFDFV